MAQPKKQKNGKYKYRIRIKHPMTGKWIERNILKRTKRECYDWEVKVRSDILDGINPDDTPLLDFFDLWFKTFKEGTVGPDHENKIRATRKSLVEFFGEKQTLKNIDKFKYQQWINFLGKTKNQAKATVKDKHKIFKSVLVEALDAGYIRTSPWRNITIVGRDTTGETKKSLTLSEWKSLRQAILDSQDSASKYIALTMMYLGLRFQEATGLCYGDIDLKNKVVKITKAFDYKRTKERTRTKTPGSVRTVDLPDDLHKILKQYMTIQRKNKVVQFKPKDSTYLFTNEIGIPITNKAINEFLKKKCREVKIDEVTSHALRRAKTDLLVLAGNDIVYTQKQLGHVDPNTTLKHYSQLNEDIRTKNNNIQDVFFKQNS